ncbi:MAG: TIGR03905 family TSCPD domain-containing protein [Christensenellales bacterium]
MRYVTSGVCSRYIDFEIENGIVTDVKFQGGCSGNTQGIAKLVVGMKADDVIEKLKGIRCGYRSTSCPDQLAKALEEVKK